MDLRTIGLVIVALIFTMYCDNKAIAFACFAAAIYFAQQPRVRRVMPQQQQRVSAQVTKVQPNPSAPQNNSTSVNQDTYDPMQFSVENTNVRRQAHLFDAKPTYQSSDARARMLDAMYTDLMHDNIREDPYLRKPDQEVRCLKRSTFAQNQCP